MFIKNLFESKKKRFNSRYVDGILVVYDISVIVPDLLTSNMNCKHKNIIFKPPPENNKYMNFLIYSSYRKSSVLKLIFIEKLQP